MSPVPLCLRSLLPYLSGQSAAGVRCTGLPDLTTAGEEGGREGGREGGIAVPGSIYTHKNCRDNY